MGSALPYPFSAVGPTAPHQLRAELVREIAARQRPRCLILIGNSRAAFGVNAEKLSTPHCEAANLAFAGFDTSELYDITHAEVQAGGVRSIVFFITDEYLIRDGIVQPQTKPSPPSLDVMLRNPPSDLVQVDWVRRVLISQYRFQSLFDTLIGRPLADNVFRWNPGLGRWIWPGNETLQMATRDDRRRMVEAVSAEYYGSARAAAGSAAELAAYIARMRLLAEKLTIIFPPQYGEFAVEVNKLRPGLQRSLIQRLAVVAAKADARFIDCSKNVDCGLSDDLFADPVHLNASGADRFTAFLKAQNLH